MKSHLLCEDLLTQDPAFLLDHVTPSWPIAALRPLRSAVWDGGSSWQGWTCQWGVVVMESGCSVFWRLAGRTDLSSKWSFDVIFSCLWTCRYHEVHSLDFLQTSCHHPLCGWSSRIPLLRGAGMRSRTRSPWKSSSDDAGHCVFKCLEQSFYQVRWRSFLTWCLSLFWQRLLFSSFDLQEEEQETLYPSRQRGCFWQKNRKSLCQK